MFLLGLLLVAPLTLKASQSYYPAKLDDPAAVYLTKDSFPVHADGVADDSEAIQAAIDKVEEQHGEGILFVPEGKYRITRTIYVWPSVRIIGYGATRPEFLLADNTPGYQHDIGYMFFFTGGRPGGRRWHARGYAVNVWTVDQAAEAQRLAATRRVSLDLILTPHRSSSWRRIEACFAASPLCRATSTFAPRAPKSNGCQLTRAPPVLFHALRVTSAGSTSPVTLGTVDCGSMRPNMLFAVARSVCQRMSVRGR